MTKQTIVLARVDEETVWDGKPFAQDLGKRAGTKAARKATTCLWLHEGGPSDVASAKRYADSENARRDASAGAWQVFTFPVSTVDARAEAARKVLAS